MARKPKRPKTSRVPAIGKAIPKLMGRWLRRTEVIASDPEGWYLRPDEVTQWRADDPNWKHEEGVFVDRTTRPNERSHKHRRTWRDLKDYVFATEAPRLPVTELMRAVVHVTELCWMVLRDHGEPVLFDFEYAFLVRLLHDVSENRRRRESAREAVRQTDMLSALTDVFRAARVDASIPGASLDEAKDRQRARLKGLLLRYGLEASEAEIDLWYEDPLNITAKYEAKAAQDKMSKVLMAPLTARILRDTVNDLYRQRVEDPRFDVYPPTAEFDDAGKYLSGFFLRLYRAAYVDLTSLGPLSATRDGSERRFRLDAEEELSPVSFPRPVGAD